jgi:hypothetical protein
MSISTQVDLRQGLRKLFNPLSLASQRWMVFFNPAESLISFFGFMDPPLQLDSNAHDYLESLRPWELFKKKKTLFEKH